ncbi:MAG: hypothetical protein GH143_07090 [Calditrichaeota bacterium]|nr:hypothetical protein [Calditrichota bacterium]
MFRLFSQLPRTPDAIKAHIEALSEVVLSEKHKDVFDHLYSCLSILDAKSSSMLSFNSIIIAVFAIFMTGQLTLTERVIANVGMAAILVSALLLLSVVWVHWSPTGDLVDAEQHGKQLLQVRNYRTVRYRIAWYLAVFSLVSLAGFLLVRLLPASG